MRDCIGVRNGLRQLSGEANSVPVLSHHTRRSIVPCALPVNHHAVLVGSRCYGKASTSDSSRNQLPALCRGMAYFKTKTINLPRTQLAAAATDSVSTEESQADFYADEGVTFESLGIHPFVQLALKQAGFNKPAHVQVGRGSDPRQARPCPKPEAEGHPMIHWVLH